MRKLIEDLARRAAPAVMANRAARYERTIREKWGLPALADAFIAVHGDHVLAGPMQGLRYTRTGDAPVAKLLGVYEIEIAGWIEEGLVARPSVFVDLGAADGYYAVGAKVRCPGIDVIAFELAPIARRELEELGAINGVQVDIRGQATAQTLADLPLHDAMLLCDIEGAEAEVLDPSPLATCTVIVELHEQVSPGVTDLLLRRFSDTHHGEIVRSAPRDPRGFPQLSVLTPTQQALALDEHRGDMAWARFTPQRG